MTARRIPTLMSINAWYRFLCHLYCPNGLFFHDLIHVELPIRWPCDDVWILQVKTTFHPKPFTVMPTILLHFVPGLFFYQIQLVIGTWSHISFLTEWYTHWLDGLCELICCVQCCPDVIKTNTPIHRCSHNFRPHHPHLTHRVLKPFQRLYGMRWIGSIIP